MLPSAAPDSQRALPLVAVVGNPNAGKTTLFNSLTGLYQKVANYPGVTVERVSGSLKLSNGAASVVDIPGLYSLDPVSEDEQVAVDVLKGARAGGRMPDLLIYVLDATNLERNLFFFSQLADAEFPMVVALTMTDLLVKSGTEIDVAKLSSLLGVEVVPVVGHKGRGVQELKAAVERNLAAPRAPVRELGFPHALELKVASLRERFARAGLDYSRTQVRQALLGRPVEWVERLGEIPELEQAFYEAKGELGEDGIVGTGTELSGRYEWASVVERASVVRPETRRLSLTHRLDRLLTHRVFGLAVFAGVTYLIFQSIYTLAQPLMAAIEFGFGQLGSWIAPALESVPWLQSLVVDGLLAGVGTLLLFLPQICILFFFISVLEGTGYLARAAFLMDKLLGWCGLSGRAFIPLLSSFACAIPGIMAARVMPDQRSRLATMLVAPLMSCSARLPVYVLLIGAFIEPAFGPAWAGFTLFAMHILGILVAIPIVWILNRGVLKGARLPFVLELPPYQWPKRRDVLLSVYFRGKVFVQTAGTIIVLMSIVIWGLLYFPRSETEVAEARTAFVAAQPRAPRAELELHLESVRMENSVLGRFGKTIEPIFEPAGFDWRLTTAILAAFPAREVMVSSLGIIFNVGKDADEASLDLRTQLQRARWPDGRPLVDPWNAVGLMVFFALCAQCGSTLATVKRETGNWKWPAFMFAYMTALAYAGAVLVEQVAWALGYR